MMSGISGDQRLYSYSAVLMGSPILLKLFSHDEALASRTFQLIKRYEDLFTVNRAHSQVMDINHAAGPSGQRQPPGLSADQMRESGQHGAGQRL
jgi:thiamine biosynthesis lipoprotein